MTTEAKNRCVSVGGKIVGHLLLTKRQANRLTKTSHEKMWSYLVRKLKPLNDNNKTAREIYQYWVKVYNESN